jgi:hypothetical protein
VWAVGPFASNHGGHGHGPAPNVNDSSVCMLCILVVICMLHHNKLPCHTPKLSRLWLAPELSRAPVSSQRALLKQQVSARRDAWRLDHWVDSSLQAHARQLSGRTDGFWPTNLHVMVWEACSACVRCVSSHERDRRLHAPRTHARTHVPSHCCGASQPSQGSTSPNHPRCGRLCCMRPVHLQ